MSSLNFMLAKEFTVGGKIDTTGWFISEKFDGYRAVYDPVKKQFFSMVYRCDAIQND